MMLLCLALYSALLAGVGHQVSTIVPEPYMDEIFHIPQARAYCAGNYTQWDPKITTLPGLYLFSLGLLRPLHLLSGPSWPLLAACTPAALRAVNLAIALANLLLLLCLTEARHGHKEGYSPRLAAWSSLNLSLLPPLFFTNFLYYTDPLSTCLVLLTYTLHLSSRPLLAALAGGLSVLCRQTNIVWVFLAALETAGRVVVSEVRAHQAATRQPTLALTTAGQLRELVQGLVGLASTGPASLARLVGLVALRCAGYIVVGLGFLAFLHLNQGIVVGDRSAHAATLHLLQLGYFSAFYLFLCLPWAGVTLRALPALLRVHRLKLVVAVVVLGAVVHWGTLAHPYLLADNRHFTFYLWRRVFMRHWTFKYLLVPVYMFGFLHIGRSLSKCDLTLKLALPVCLALSLVPQLLLEFRYFIIPFLLVRAQVRPDSPRLLAAETVLLAVINIATIGIFLLRPFPWASEPGALQRFMW